MRISTVLILLGILGLGVFIAFFDRGDVQTTTDYREASRTRLFRDLDRLRGLRLEKEGIICDLTLEGEQWTFAEPAGAPARNGAIRQILDELKGVKTGALLTEEELATRGLTLSELGLDPPVARIDFRTDPDPYTLWLGARTALSPTLYARDSRNNQVVTLDAKILDVFPVSTLDLRDTILGFPQRQDIMRLELERPEGFLQLARNDKGIWTMLQPQELRVEQERVHQFLDALAALKMESIITDTPDDLGSYGLVEPALALRWWQGEALNPESLKIGTSPEDRDTEVFAQLSRFPTVFTLPTTLRRLLEAPAQTFRDKRILPLEPDAISAVRISSGKEKLTLGREVEGWKIIEPAPIAMAEGSQVQALLEDWCAATTLRFPPDEMLETLLTNEVEYRLEFMLASSNATGVAQADTLRQIDLFRSEDPTVILAYLPQEKTLYEISAQLKGGLSLSPLHFHDRTITALQPEDVLRVSHQGPQGLVHVIRDKASSEWQIENDVCILNENAFLALLRASCSIEAHRLVNLQAVDLSEYGLDQPMVQLTLGLRGGDVISNTLVLGKPLPAGGGHYAMLRGQQVVFELDPATSRLLLQPFCVKL